MTEFLYKFIDLDQRIIDEITNYSNTILPESQRFLNSFNSLSSFYHHCPITKEWIYSNNTELLFCHRLIWNPARLFTPHTDFNHDPDNIEKYYFDDPNTKITKNVIGLNFVISESNDSELAFYSRLNNNYEKQFLKILDNVDGLNRENNFITYYRFEDLVEIARIKADRPFLLNSTVPHCVIHHSNAPRVTISLRFNPDPWHLVKL
jgi:hypothetical protein